MARRGEVVENPITGEKIIFLRTTGGESLRFEYVLPPRFSIPEHVHPRQEVLSGTLRGRIGGRERDYGELRIVSELRPALHMEALLEVGFGIARDLQSDKKGIPKHLMANEAKGDFYFTGVPGPVRRKFSVLLEALAYAGGRLGYEARSPRYSSFE